MSRHDREPIHFDFTPPTQTTEAKSQIQSGLIDATVGIMKSEGKNPDKAEIIFREIKREQRKKRLLHLLGVLEDPNCPLQPAPKSTPSLKNPF